MPLLWFPSVPPSVPPSLPPPFSFHLFLLLAQTTLLKVGKTILKKSLLLGLLCSSNGGNKGACLSADRRSESEPPACVAGECLYIRVCFGQSVTSMLWIWTNHNLVSRHRLSLPLFDHQGTCCPSGQGGNSCRIIVVVLLVVWQQESSTTVLKSLAEVSAASTIPPSGAIPISNMPPLLCLCHSQGYYQTP